MRKQEPHVGYMRTEKRDWLMEKAQKKTGNDMAKTIEAGLHHVARICARCEQVGDCPWRSEGYPYCTPCVERDSSIKLDDYS